MVLLYHEGRSYQKDLCRLGIPGGLQRQISAAYTEFYVVLYIVCVTISDDGVTLVLTSSIVCQTKQRIHFWFRKVLGGTFSKSTKLLA